MALKISAPYLWKNITRNNVMYSLARFQNVRFYNEAATSIFKPIVNDNGNRLEIKMRNWSQNLNFSYIWLRDHCRCSTCYNQETSQRILDLYAVPTSITPTSVKSLTDGISINWPDGHQSTYDYKFLYQNSAEGNATLKFPVKKTWNKRSFPHITDISIPAAKCQSGSAGAQFLVNSILTHGVGIVSDVLPTAEATEAAVTNICQLQETFYGKLFTLEANNAFSDLAYSTERLTAHTDGTYFTESPRIQVFHILKAAPKGGETILVDGFQIAKKFQKLNPKGFKFLSDYEIPSEYIGNGHHYKAFGPVFRNNKNTGELDQFRYNIYDRAPLSSLPFKDVDEYYHHLTHLTDLVRSEENEQFLKLEPGQVLFIDNWRVMHGREAFSGRRILSGCYLDQNNFSSKARTLGFNV